MFQVDSLQKPNSSFILTEPGRLPLSVKESLLTFLFEEVKVARVCLLPKALAISKLFDVDTCIVVDSGATSTSVWVVVDGKVDESKTQVNRRDFFYFRAHFCSEFEKRPFGVRHDFELKDQIQNPC